MNIKIMIKKQCLLLLVIWLANVQANTLQAQINFQFMPAVNGQSVNGLFTAQLYNSSQANYTGKIKITVKDGNNKTVVLALTPLLNIKAGGNPLMAFGAQSRIQFGNTPSGNIAAQTGRFAEDEYEYCFEFVGEKSKSDANEEIFENCFNHIIQPLIPLSLVYPGDGDEICNLRPEFTWQPAMPLNNNLRYRLLVAEKKEKQQSADALLNNVPVFQQDNIAGFMLMYPPQVPALQKDKKYTWQVTAYNGNTKMLQSEIWEFSTKCEEKKIDSVKESYRQLSETLNGNFYMATNILKFSINNAYSKQKMEYSISDLSAPEKSISNLPSIKLTTGLNKVDIELEDIKGLELNKMYLITIRNVGNQPLFLRFIYKGEGAL